MSSTVLKISYKYKEQKLNKKATCYFGAFGRIVEKNKINYFRLLNDCLILLFQKKVIKNDK
ncbi:hypothetical protein, partial [Riemerella anatipestifer]|uniref:hypothetical protein n=1 Tax=Riemerella anatipestifer TaxID=34085 RepID=UPI0021F87B8A